MSSMANTDLIGLGDPPLRGDAFPIFSLKHFQFRNAHYLEPR